MKLVHAVLAACAVSALGCDGITPAIDWNRMVDQHRAESQAASSFFSDRRAMREPPRHTVPLDGRRKPDARSEGLADGRYITTLPVALERPLLERGRARFERFCAPCHGVLGDGVSAVAERMQLRKPPALVEEPVRSLPVGRVFQVIGNGYGLMPSYAQELDVAERWAVVAYLQALTLSHAAPLASLPESVRRSALEQLP